MINLKASGVKSLTTDFNKLVFDEAANLISDITFFTYLGDLSAHHEHLHLETAAIVTAEKFVSDWIYSADKSVLDDIEIKNTAKRMRLIAGRLLDAASKLD